VRDLIVEPDPSGSRTGGILRVDARSPSEVVLRSVRFTCEGCRRRVRAALEASRGVVSVEAMGAREAQDRIVDDGPGATVEPWLYRPLLKLLVYGGPVRIDDLVAATGRSFAEV